MSCEDSTSCGIGTMCESCASEWRTPQKIPATPEGLAELYREQLGLRTWEEQAAIAEDLRQKIIATSDPTVERGRRSGRTTRGLLYAIAKSVLTDRRVLFIRADRMVVADHAAAAARELIGKLGLELRVKALYSKTHIHGNIYYDHYFDTSWRRR